MRLIDADALIKQAQSDGAYDYVSAHEVADAAEIDAVPVVRCKDCKFSKPHERFEKLIKCMRPYNCKHGLNFPKEGFCSYGEKMEDKQCG